ncbi:unnamed protein product [Rhizoctonia solani]|uniref:Uncharacterized protein n=1 Tax=Rhizoctonia solani TaxID=456999 RepID=A0A8H3BN28_9AGAM
MSEPVFSSALERMLFGAGGYNQFADSITRSVDRHLAQRDKSTISKQSPLQVHPLPAPLVQPEHVIPRKRKSPPFETSNSDESETMKLKHPDKAWSESPGNTRPPARFTDRPESTPLRVSKKKKLGIYQMIVDLSDMPRIPKSQAVNHTDSSA